MFFRLWLAFLGVLFGAYLGANLALALNSGVEGFIYVTVLAAFVGSLVYFLTGIFADD